MSDDAVLKKISELLDNAKRYGTEKDEPEGSRYIQISDTLARQLSEDLKRIWKT